MRLLCLHSFSLRLSPRLCFNCSGCLLCSFVYLLFNLFSCLSCFLKPPDLILISVSFLSPSCLLPVSFLSLIIICLLYGSLQQQDRGRPPSAKQHSGAPPSEGPPVSEQLHLCCFAVSSRGPLTNRGPETSKRFL